MCEPKVTHNDGGKVGFQCYDGLLPYMVPSQLHSYMASVDGNSISI